MLFEPFGVPTPSQKKVVIGFWIVACAIIWQFFPGDGLPRPLGTGVQFLRLYNRGLVIDLMVSLKTILRAGPYAFVAGTLLGYLYLIPFFNPIIQLFASFRNASMASLVAAFILLHFGGDDLKVLTMTFVIGVYFLASLVQIFADIPRDEIDHGFSMGQTPMQVLWHRVVRGKFHLVVAAFLPCLAMGWSILSVVEGLARDQGGLGDVMLQVDKINSYESLLALTLVSMAFGFGMWFGLWRLYRKVFRYNTQVVVR